MKGQEGRVRTEAAARVFEKIGQLDIGVRPGARLPLDQRALQLARDSHWISAPCNWGTLSPAGPEGAPGDRSNSTSADSSFRSVSQYAAGRLLRESRGSAKSARRLAARLASADSKVSCASARR